MEVSEIIEVICATLSEVLKHANAPKRIDLLGSDGEGCEVEVLDGIDFIKYKSRYILMETNSFDKIRLSLKRHGYSKAEPLSYHNFLFKLNHVSDTEL
jgi:hypothetical protein